DRLYDSLDQDDPPSVARPVKCATPFGAEKTKSPGRTCSFSGPQRRVSAMPASLWINQRSDASHHLPSLPSFLTTVRHRRSCSACRPRGLRGRGLDAEQLADLAQALRELDVLARRRRIAAGVIVHENDR